MTSTLLSTRSSYVAGRWLDNPDAKTVETRDPGRPDEVVGRYALATERETQEAIASAAAAAPAFAQTNAAERSDLVYDFLRLWADRQDDLADIATREMGKTRAESYGETSRVFFEARFWAGEALRGGGQTFPSTRPNTDIRTIRQPIGPVAAITPWNFPILTPVRKVIPALVNGCPVLLKPAMQAPGTTVIVAEILHELGLPAGVFSLLLGSGRETGLLLVESPEIAGITFTGSTEVGLGIATRAAARNARTQLEMGGKNAAVVSQVEDVDRVASEIAGAAFTASGQRCTSISRVIVVPEIREALEQALARAAQKYVVGHGLEEGTTMGPVVDRASFERTQRYIAEAQSNGARVLVGGEVLDPSGESGYFVPPTILTDVAPGSPLAVDEVFAPVLAVIPVADIDQAIAVTNETQYGLTASVFADNGSVARRVAMASRSGMVHVNHGTVSEGHIPFGGVAQSGQGAFGIGATSTEFFTSLKVIYDQQP
ncbi:aldehyde dehydrogenase family protein [Microcella alkaliphila]|uniref:Aldehyde dehydrogenase n=1 Tax=Microcella alkaliphila TaxID=279828 RepID=A0A0U4WST1_9MICO|nr:aldehyde dehydrogenase family protein [Microcella alkaliphila]BAU30983.1 aldehyde dehydrogenase [Microcella alkaliphila]